MKPYEQEQEQEQELKEKELIESYKRLNSENQALFVRALFLLVDGPETFKEEFVAISKQSGPIWGDIKVLLDRYEQKAEREAS